MAPARPGTSTLSSLYLDTPTFDVLRRNGSYGRAKYRIRRYQAATSRSWSGSASAPAGGEAPYEVDLEQLDRSKAERRTPTGQAGGSNAASRRVACVPRVRCPTTVRPEASSTTVVPHG